MRGAQAAQLWFLVAWAAQPSLVMLWYLHNILQSLFCLTPVAAEGCAAAGARHCTATAVQSMVLAGAVIKLFRRRA